MMSLFDSDPRLPPVEQRPQRLVDLIPKQLRAGRAFGLRHGWTWMKAEVAGFDVKLTLVTSLEDDPAPHVFTISQFVIFTEKGPMYLFWSRICAEAYRGATHRSPVWCAEWDDFDRFHWSLR